MFRYKQALAICPAGKAIWLGGEENQQCHKHTAPNKQLGHNAGLSYTQLVSAARGAVDGAILRDDRQWILWAGLGVTADQAVKVRSVLGYDIYVTLYICH